jgi:hypothetical protein
LRKIGEREEGAYWVFSPPGSVSIRFLDEFDMMFLETRNVLNMD